MTAVGLVALVENARRRTRVYDRGRLVGSYLVRYPEDVRHTSSLELSSAIPYPSQPPSLSSADCVSDNHFRHEGRAS